MTQVDRAGLILLRLLADGPAPVTQVEAAVAAAGIRRWALIRARKRMQLAHAQRGRRGERRGGCGRSYLALKSEDLPSG